MRIHGPVCLFVLLLIVDLLLHLRCHTALDGCSLFNGMPVARKYVLRNFSHSTLACGEESKVARWRPNNKPKVHLLK